MYITKGGVTRLINDGTFPYWKALGWSLDADVDGVADGTGGGGGGSPTTDASALSTGILPSARIGDDSILEVKLAPAVRTKLAAAGSGTSGVTVQDENGNVSTAVTQIDFQGAGVTATAGTGEVVVTIPGGGGGTSNVTTGTTDGQIPVYSTSTGKYEPAAPTDATASDIAVTPTGTISSTTVQAALAELDAEKVPLSEMAERVQDLLGSSIVAGSNITVTYDDAAGTLTITGAAAGAASNTVLVQDEGGTATAVSKLNFVGATVTETNTGGVATITVTSSGGGGGLTTLEQYKPTAYATETITRVQALGSSGAAVLTSATLRLQLVYLKAGQVVSSIAFLSGSTAASAPTAQWAALYDINRNKLATSSDLGSASWPAATVKTFDLTAGSGAYTVPSDGLYYVGLVVVATTVPTLIGLGGSGSLNGLAPILAGNSSGGQTTPGSAPATAAAISASGAIFWAGIA